jgi:hypothetical protein
MNTTHIARRSNLVVLSMLLAGCFVFLTTVSGQTATEIINKHLQAIGGVANVNAMKSYRFEFGSGTVVYYKSPAKWRVDHLEDGKVIQSAVFFGEKGWRTDKDGSSEPDYGAMSFENYLTGYLAYVNPREFTLESKGKDPESDNLLLRATSILHSSGYYDFYINPKTYLITKMIQSMSGYAYEVSFEDYTTINGIKIPLKITKKNVDSDSKSSTVKTNVKINIPLDDKLFQKPVLAKKLYDFRDASGKYGFRDESFNVIVKPVYDDVRGFAENGLAKVTLNKLSGFIDGSGKLAIPLVYVEANNFDEGLAAVKINGKWGYIDAKGKLIIPADYDSQSIFRDGIASAKRDSKWGYIDKTGAIVIPFEYDAIGFFKDGKTTATKKGIKMTIDKTGKQIN